MAELPLTQGYVAIVDDADLDWLSQWNWRAMTKNKRATTFYAYRSSIKSDGLPRKTALYLHRVITDASPGLLVDHIDRNGLNCQRSNLRVVTAAESAAYTRWPAGESGYRGVIAVRTKGKLYGWTAKLSVGDRTHYLGFRKSAEEAARLYDEAALRLRGKFAILNFPAEEAAA